MQEHNATSYLLAESLVCEGLDPMSESYALGKMTDASMEPVIPEGAVIGVDFRPTRVCPGVPYFVGYDGLRGVRYIEHLAGGGMKLISTNPHYDDIELTFGDILGLSVIGRVFHWEEPQRLAS